MINRIKALLWRIKKALAFRQNHADKDTIAQLKKDRESKRWRKDR